MLPWAPMNWKNNQSIIFLLSQFAVVESFSRSYYPLAETLLSGSYFYLATMAAGSTAPIQHFTRIL